MAESICDSFQSTAKRLMELGLDGYLQEKEAADSAYTPAFMDEESVRLFPKESENKR